MHDLLIQYFPNGLGNKTVFYSIAVASLLIALEAKINTKNIIKIVGLFAACVGALIYANGTPNIIMWFGILVFVLTLLNELVDYCRAQRVEEDLSRRNDA